MAIVSLQDSLEWADYYYNIHRYEKAITLYKKNLDLSGDQKAHILKKLSLSEAALNKPEESVEQLYEYLSVEYNSSFLMHEGFDPIRESAEFKKVYDKIVPNITVWSMIYFLIALLGFYVMFVIYLNKRIDFTACLLISGFIFIHSFFILNISINRSNYEFEYPHTYLMSTWASFLYGPLLYFYFKRTTTKHVFKKIDLLHLIPTLLLIGYLIPAVYWMSGEDKTLLMLNRLRDGVSPQDSSKLILIVTLKIISLAVYAYFIRKVYLKAKASKLLQAKNQRWQKNIYYIHVLYVITYTIYGIVIINGRSTEFFYYSSIAAMSLMVIYVGYAANVQPDVFSGIYVYTNRLFPKYIKSGLTPTLSDELKEQLIHLFQEEKLYRENDINLEMVAERLNTTRHNASQVINEHFKLSFHELVNKYRIEEAKSILGHNHQEKLNIIDVAYGVGYNNKVTFNKAFKKDTQLTPTQYLASVKQRSRISS